MWGACWEEGQGPGLALPLLVPAAEVMLRSGNIDTALEETAVWFAMCSFQSMSRNSADIRGPVWPGQTVVYSAQGATEGLKAQQALGRQRRVFLAKELV